MKFLKFMYDEYSIDPAAVGSDVARSRWQMWARRFAEIFVRLTRLNSGGFITTEIIQKIAPVSRIPLNSGELILKSGHGRLRWRALSFYEEEPQTIEWLDKLTPRDVLWDVGANVGAFSIYAALQSKCQVFAFEPEAQNFALLIENIVLNNVQARTVATNIALTKSFGLGELFPHAVTKGGAYNQFFLTKSKIKDRDSELSPTGVSQLQFGVSIDELVSDYEMPFPTHLKIDVDGNEHHVIEGSLSTLRDKRLKSVLIELDPSSEAHQRARAVIEESGLQFFSSRSNWEYRKDRSRESEFPQINITFVRP